MHQGFLLAQKRVFVAKQQKWRRLENGEIEYDPPTLLVALGMKPRRIYHDASCEKQVETLLDDRAFKPENLITAIITSIRWFITWPARIVIKLWSGKYSLQLAFWWFYIFGWIPYCFFMLIFCFPLELLGIHAIRMLLPIGMLYVPLVSVG